MAVVRIQITRRESFAGGAPFGDTGRYDLLEGWVWIAVDPVAPANAWVTDLERARRGPDAMVQARADLRLLLPVDPERGNRRLLFDVVNRGNATALSSFNNAGGSAGTMEPGDGFLMRRGYAIASCGWQGDLQPRPGLLRAHLPEAHSESGGPLRGRIAITFQPAADSRVWPLAAGCQEPHPPDDPLATDASLLVRDHENAAMSPIPREAWAFARLEDGELVPDCVHVCLQSGFDAGRIYTLVYTTSGARPLGMGLLIPRDLVSFLRYSADDANPCAGAFDRAYAYGRSQSGSFIRHMLYGGATQDEDDRRVFDGVISLVSGGGRGEFNHRFGQPGAGPKQTIGRTFPFADRPLVDPLTGRRGGLLDTLNARGQTPKVFFINTSSEYWRGDAALIHVAPDGSRDLASHDNVRIYHYAGTQHAPGQLPPPAPADTAGILPGNMVDYRPLLRAALINLDGWASDALPPPPSCHPRLDDGTAVQPQQVERFFRAIPGSVFPRWLHGAHRMDFGPRAGDGMLTTLPPAIGAPYPLLVPGVDDDGNELAGIRHPDLSAPLATHTGWNVRHPSIGGSGQILTLVGASIPFPVKAADREAAGDPRRAIDERYACRDEYLRRVRHAADALVAARHLLAEDLDAIVERAGRLYDLLTCAGSGP